MIRVETWKTDVRIAPAFEARPAMVVVKFRLRVWGPDDADFAGDELPVTVTLPIAMQDEPLAMIIKTAEDRLAALLRAFADALDRRP